MIKVVVADDHGVVRAGLCRLIDSEKDMEVVGEAADGREAVKLCKKLKPDVVVLDYDMPGIDGLEATRQIVELKLAAKILILTIFGAVIENDIRIPVEIIINIAKSALCRTKEATTIASEMRITAQYQSAVFSFLLYSSAFQEILCSI